jgi:hypothetical protein
VTNTFGIEVETMGPESSDIDLYLLYDANGDGFFLGDPRELVDYSFGGGSSEYVSHWGDFDSGYQVQDGTYAVVMYGYDVMPGDQFDLHLTTYGGEGLSIVGAGPENNYVLDVTPGETEGVMVNWEVPGPGVWSGYLWFAMPWEEEPVYWYQGSYVYVPVTINAYGVDLSGSSKVVDKETVLMSSDMEGQVTLTYTVTLVNEGTEDVYVQMVDKLPEGTVFYKQAGAVQPEDPALSQLEGGGAPEYYVAKAWNDVGGVWYFSPGDYCPGDYNNGQGSEYDGGDSEYLCWYGEVGPSTSGTVYIEYKVKILPHFAGEIMNKADVWMGSSSCGESSCYHQFFALKAFTDVYYATFLPFVTGQ